MKRPCTAAPLQPSGVATLRASAPTSATCVAPIGVDCTQWLDPLGALNGSCWDRRNLVEAVTYVVPARARRVLARGALQRRSLAQELEDVTQDVLEALFANDARALRRWDPERGLKFLGFVGLIAEREVLSMLRGRRSREWRETSLHLTQLELLGVVSQSPEDAFATAELFRLLCVRMARQTTSKTYLIFRMLYLEEREPREVSQALGISLECVYTHQTRLRRRASSIALRDDCAI